LKVVWGGNWVRITKIARQKAGQNSSRWAAVSRAQFLERATSLTINIRGVTERTTGDAPANTSKGNNRKSQPVTIHRARGFLPEFVFMKANLKIGEKCVTTTTA